MLASVLNLNPWVQFVCAALLIVSMVWGLIWGGIRLWHRRATRSLKDAFSDEVRPLFDELRGEVLERLSTQDAILEHVEHEISLNSGSSVKDGVNILREQSNEHTRRLNELKESQSETNKLQLSAMNKITDLAKDLASHISYHKGFESAQKR